jgi:replicative DNA helicase
MSAAVHPLRPSTPAGRADPAAERAILGGVLLSPDALTDVEPLVAPEDFHVEANGFVFGAMLACRERGAAIDPVTVAAELRSRGQLEQVGGEARVAALMHGVSTAAGVESYARIVADHAVARRVGEAARDVAAKAADPRVSVEELADVATARVLGATERRSSAVAIDECVRGLLAEIGRPDAAPPAVKTGFSALDRETGGGFRPGELVILAARPRVGKSALAMQIARNVAASRAVLVYSLEMTRVELTERMLACESRVDHRAVRSRRIPASSAQAFIAAANVVHGLALHIDETPSIQIGELRARTRRHARRHDLGLVVVDYLQLVVAPKCDSREQAVATVARGLKSLAKEIGVPVLALAQVNRAGKDAPSLETLRESGEIEATANVVMLLHREELVSKRTERRGVADVILAKQRNAPSGVTAELRFTGTSVRFDDMPEADDPAAADTHWADGAAE